MARTSLILILVVALLALAPPATAKKNNPNIDLEFLPQQSIGAAVANLSGGMLDRSVSIEVVDDRRQDDASVIGTRTDDDDRRHNLKATSDVVSFVQETLQQVAGDWGLRVDSDSRLKLRVRLLEIKVLETNQPVGATYNATARVAYSLEDVSATAFGDATRYGKKFSNDNCNEVLSDALLEAFAEMVNSDDLQRAWGK